jgi:Bacterial self-protective colicin-like immunity
MSTQLTVLAKEFVDGRLTGLAFVDDFIRLWKQERDDGRLLRDPPEISEALSSIFCFADLYNPEPDRDEYEFDENKLREAVRGALRRE